LFAAFLLIAGGCGEEEPAGGGFGFAETGGGTTTEETGEESEETGSSEESGEETGPELHPDVAPEVEFSGTGPTGCVPGGDFTVKVEASHPDGIESVTLVLDEQTSLPFENTADEDWELSLADWPERLDGPFVATLEALSTSGALLAVAIEWNRDSADPLLTLTGPKLAAVIEGKLVVQGEATDLEGCGIVKIETHLIDVTNGDAPVTYPVETELHDPETSDTTTVPFAHSKDTSEDGSFKAQVFVRATDGAGNSAEVVQDVFVVKPLAMLSAQSTDQSLQVVDSAAGDFNGDGFLDVFFATGSGLFVVPSLGNGDFQDPIQLTEENVGFVDLADANGDEVADLFLFETYGDGKGLQVYAITESGLELIQSVPLPDESLKNMGLADLNGDGQKDIVVTTDGASKAIGVVASDPEQAIGPFLGVVEWHGGPAQIRHLAFGDFDGDGIDDVVVSSSGNNKIDVFTSDGDGGFGASYSTILEKDALQMVALEINGDNDLDLVVALDKGAGREIRILGGLGNGEFVPSAIPLITGGKPMDFVSADLDGNGYMDLAIPFAGSNTVAVVLGDGHNLSVESKYVAGPQPSAIFAGHFTASAGDDIVVVNEGNGGRITLLASKGAGEFHAAIDLWQQVECTAASCAAVGHSDFAIGQLDGLPGLDIAAITDTYSPEDDKLYHVYLHLSDGVVPEAPVSAKFDVSAYFAPENASWSEYGKLVGIEVGDYDGDGTQDLAVAHDTGWQMDPSTETIEYSPANVDVFLNQPQGFIEIGANVWIGRDPALFNVETSGPVDKGISGFVAVDVDADGLSDLVGACDYIKNTPDEPAISAHLSPWLSVAGLFKPGPPSPVDINAQSDPGLELMIPGDVNGDGAMDLLSINADVDSVGVHYGDSLGSFQDAYLFSALSPGVRVASLEQLNGDEDNYPDLISVGDEAVFIAYGRQHAIGDNPFDPPVTFLYLGSKPTAVTSADLNKDGLKDVIILDEALSVAFMHANVAQREFSSTPLEIFTSAGPRQLKTADLDEDGCMDLVARTATGITVLRNQLCD